MPDTPMPPHFKAYKGDEPYIFVSYSHADADSVYPELDSLRDRGYRIWYDERIKPSKEWMAEIESALESAAFFIVFISPSAVASRYIRMEVNLAIHLETPILAIYLVETELHHGLKLGIGDIQSILKYRISADNYGSLVEAALPEHLRSRPALQPTESAVLSTIGAASDVLRPVPIVLINSIDGAEMLWIPPGEFLMGDDDRSDNPRHTVTLSGYWIYKNVVTAGQYREYCESTGAAMPLEPGHLSAGGSEMPKFNPGWSKADHPIVNVTWDDAQAYCKWAGVSLPSEAQWEKAARGTDGRKFPWGNVFDTNQAWLSKTHDGDAGGTTSVGLYGLSPYGCSDMAGNVWQWCGDWYSADYNANVPAKDPTGPKDGHSRVLRGGSWGLKADSFFRAACRNWYYPDYGDEYIGFRCAKL